MGNCALKELPQFKCLPDNSDPHIVGPQHKGTIHFVNKMEELENAYREASVGIPASKPVIEMTIPSSVDNTLAPAGHYVAQLFVQFVPYDLDPKIGNWADNGFKK